MGDAHVPEFLGTRGSGFGKKKKRKVKKKVKRNVLPPTKSANKYPQDNIFNRGLSPEEIRDYYDTLDRIFDLNP